MLEGVVQVDESYFGKRRSKQPQHIVVGAKDTATGRIALRITDSRDRQPLEQFVQDYIVAGSLVAIDKWWAYDELELTWLRSFIAKGALPVPTKERISGA